MKPLNFLKKYGRLFISFCLLLLSCVLLENTKQLSDKDYHHVMFDASERTQRAFEAIKAEKLYRGLSISPLDDPNMTGMIGAPYTDTTTTLGDLEAKRSTTNPNISAMIVDMLEQCHIKSGDTVAVNFSGSFPCANIAALCAMDAMGVNGIVISSVGASTYGANLSEFTYQDMEYFLYKNSYITNHSSYFSMGGVNDQGKEFPTDLKETIRLRLQSYGLAYLNYDDLEENIAARIGIYQSLGEVSCFINAGGNLLSFGGGSEMTSVKNGLIMPGSSSKSGTGLIPEFIKENVPVIHLLNMKSLLPSYGLPIDPIPLPPVGSGDVYRHFSYNIPLAIVLLLLNAGWLLWSSGKFPHRKYPL
ncbi:MAG: poly-gamma-glutamate system protein [Clostridium sp.]